MLICPLCQQPLQTADAGLSCPANHHFDRARQGYFNLLPVQFKKNLAPGDNATMVDARRRFLDAGHYAFLAAHLATMAQQAQPQQWIDIGCGEGYYTAAVAAALPHARGYALDISREAVKRGVRRAPSLTWMVASMARVPLADASLDLIVSIFSPLDWTEAARLLKPGGHVLRLGPGHQHLLELRQKLYDEVRDYQDDKHLQQLPDTLVPLTSEKRQRRMVLSEAGSRTDLLAMTPHGWRATEARRELIVAEPLTVTVEGRFDLLQRRG